MAIWQTLKKLNKQQLTRKNIVLLIDSVAAIQAVANQDSQDKKVILAIFKNKISANKRNKGDTPIGPITLRTARNKKSKLPSEDGFT
jgi:hypothetical protein